jgi:hypothetical protein
MTLDLRVLGVGDEDTGATLRLISQARRSLAEARTMPGFQWVMEVASVAEDAAHRAAKLAKAHHAAAEVVDAANAAANDAASVRIEAQAKAGELLREMAESGMRKSRGDAISQPVTSLSDLGVGRMEATRWQRVAEVPEPVRQEYVEDTRTERGEVSTAGLLRFAQQRGSDQAPDRPATRSIDHPAIAAEARKRMRTVHRVLVALSGYRPESLVSALDQGERKDLLRAVVQLPAWIDDVKRELAIHRVSEEE